MITDSLCVLFLDVGVQNPSSEHKHFPSALMLCVKEIVTSVYCNGAAHHPSSSIKLVLQIL